MNTLHAADLTLEPQRAAHADEMFVVLGDPAIYAYENQPPVSVEWLRVRYAMLESRRSPDGREHWLNWVIRAADGGLGHGLRCDAAARARRQSGMNSPSIDLSPLHKSLAMLNEALDFWHAQPQASPLKPHLRSAVIQSFEFTYELSVRLLRRVLLERAVSADRVADLSFNDTLRAAADAGLMPDPMAWREWREMRNASSHAYDEVKAQAVAIRAAAFAVDASALLGALKASLAA